MALRFLFFPVTLLCCLLWGALPDAFSAAAPPPAAAPHTGDASHRWLFVIETSADMKPKREGLSQVLRQLLQSQMDSQIVQGQTVGLWTFDRTLTTGKFPLQRWTGQGAETTTNLLNFVQKQPLQNAPAIGAVMQPLLALVENSDLLTIIIVSTGQGEVKGTPFDSAINREWATWRADSSSRPLVTALRSVDGKLVSFKVSSGDFPVEMPPLPTRTIAQTTTNTNTNTAPARPQPTQERTNVAAPLVFKGPNKKTSSELTTTNAVEPAITNAGTTGALTNAQATAVEPTATNFAPNSTERPAPAANSNALAVAPPQALPGLTDLNKQPPVSVSPDEKVPGGPEIKKVVPIWIWAGSVIFLLAVLTLAFLWLRRPSGRGSSLITESIDRNK